MENKDNANIAADTAINQVLEENFSFTRKEIDPYNELCWHDNGPLSHVNTEALQSMEYYYNLLNENVSKTDGGNSGQFILGNHGEGEGESQDAESEEIEEFIKKMDDMLSDGEKKALEDMVEQHYCDEKDYDMEEYDNKPGTSAGNTWITLEEKEVKQKKKWETVIKKWARLQLREDRRDVEQWAILNRRFTLLPKNLIIPSENEMDFFNQQKGKIEVWFFQDTSRSCAQYKDRFFRAAESLPKNKFSVKMHCFDTKVYETDLESRKLHGFGGTSFEPIERYILKNSTTYPKAVFIITDGYARPFSCSHPEKWYWFLTSDGSRSAIPKGSNIFFLKDYE